MKILLYGISLILVLLASALILKVNKLKNVEYKNPDLENKKILTVYYSNGGNTKSIAENIQSIAGGDIKEIELIEKYPDNIFKMSKLVRKQQKEGYLVKIEDIDISNYDIIIAGSPIWGLNPSLPFKTFLKNGNFENKTLIPFFSYSGGAGKKKIFEEIKNSTNAKEVKKPMFMFENGLFLQKEQIINWLNKV